MKGIFKDLMIESETNFVFYVSTTKVEWNKFSVKNIYREAELVKVYYDYFVQKIKGLISTDTTESSL